MGWMSALSNIGSGAMSAASSISLHDLTGGWSDYSERQSSAKYQGKLNARLAREMAAWEALNLPALQVQGLRSAGLNPLLAVSNGISTPHMSVNTQMHPSTGGDSKPFSAFSALERQQVKNAKKEGEVLQSQKEVNEATTAKLAVDSVKSGAETDKTRVDTVKDVTAPIISSAATVYHGKKAGDAAKALVGAGLTKNSAQDIIKDVAPKAASSARQANSLWPVLGGLLGVGLPAAVGAGAGYLQFVNPKTRELYRKGDLKRHDKYLQHGNYSR